MNVVVVGAHEVSGKFAALPDRLRAGAQLATPRGAQLEAEIIRRDTPRLTGALAGSIQVSVTRTPDGARGRVFSDERYVGFVERGTTKHGPARRMFERGSTEAGGQVEDVYRAAVDEIAASFR